MSEVKDLHSKAENADKRLTGDKPPIEEGYYNEGESISVLHLTDSHTYISGCAVSGGGKNGKGCVSWPTKLLQAYKRVNRGDCDNRHRPAHYLLPICRRPEHAC